jgi:hypothetical protein
MTLLDIALFATADANWQLALDEYVNAANYHLASYDMRLNLYPGTPGAPIGIPLEGPFVDPAPDGDFLSRRPGDLRFACSVVLPQGHGIPVIFSRFPDSNAGQTVYTEDAAANRGVQWLNYVLIRENYINSDRGCLLHELIHAANYVGDLPGDYVVGRIQHDVDQTSIMRPYPVPDVPVVMQERHAAALRSSYFARAV